MFKIADIVFMPYDGRFILMSRKTPFILQDRSEEPFNCSHNLLFVSTERINLLVKSTKKKKQQFTISSSKSFVKKEIG